MTTVTGPELADVEAVVEQVWSSYLGDEPLLPRLLEPGTPFDEVAAWSAAVSVGGGWTGIITVELAEPVAVRLTREMLALPETDAEPLSDADVADAVGELVNMVGGNIKSLMPGPSVLTLPVVAAGRAAHSTDSVEVARLDAVWQGHPMRVSVHRLSAPTS